MRTLALIAATVASLAACGDAGTAPYDPDSDTTRGMGDAGAGAITDRPEACLPGLLWCGGRCASPSSSETCGRCGRSGGACIGSARCVPSGSSYSCAP